MSAAHLIGAYGMLWDRDEVSWNPGSGAGAWQLLGRVNKNTPALQVCDFRRAQGFYVLFDEFRANYVGLARGRYGIGARLRSHARHRDNWTRFCWFAIDDVIPDRRQGWSRVDARRNLPRMGSEVILRECEALLITILGSKDQNEMRFQHGPTVAPAARGGLPARRHRQACRRHWLHRHPLGGAGDGSRQLSDATRRTAAAAVAGVSRV